MTPFSLIALLCVGVMTLSPRDAIDTSNMKCYDTFMSHITDNEFLDIYTEDGKVIIDVYGPPFNRRVKSMCLEPGANAAKYFEQKREQTDAAELQ
ncbi:hypothetical protein F53441_9649 [Fusarium austroafricanum]|uniref:Uncharacterized protein n=1 Tax=Fusarium austroafricanum TaxID=2364996 RepID=A0A8H4NW59_9HYPO|nr:hypothetical protein F53441_9649 [Fusarium austroafricanum]